ncbi:MAG: hypothetical protein KatS3mg103_1195 [Phycisphaerales bacterium]|nr:MAG: hypothetical protein KatS3mg103_1195 [Phycisphaerales bacterium]
MREAFDVTLGQQPLAYLAHAFFADHLPEAIGAGPDDPIDAVVWANRGGGKTFLGAVATLLDMVYKPGIEVRILGGSLEQAQRMHAHLRRLVALPVVADLVEGRATDRRLELVNGSRLELLAQSQASVRGTRIQKLRCDEVELFDPAVWDAAQLTTRSRVIQADGQRLLVRGSIEALSTMHRAHGLMRDVVAQAQAGTRRLFRWGVVDVLERCPEHRACRGCALWPECQGVAKDPDRKGGHLTIDDALRLKGRVSQGTWEAEMLCNRPRSDDLVLPEFDASLHVRPAPAIGEGWSCVLGMDFGYRSPTVVLFAALSPEGLVHVVGERVASRCLLSEHVEAIFQGLQRLGLPEPLWIGIDPAGWQGNAQTGVSDAQQLQRAGLHVRARRTSVRSGLELLRARLRPADGPPTLLVAPSCVHLIESLERYHYDMQRPMSEEPAKDGPDHAVDALRYLVTNLDRPAELRTGSYLGGHRRR